LTDLLGRAGSHAGGVRPDLVPFLCGELAAGRGAHGFPPGTELGQGQVGGQLPAAEPHRAAAASGIAGHGDGVSGDLAGITGAESLPDQYPGVGQAGEEFRLAGGACCGGADRPPERHPRRFGSAVPAGLLVLCAGWATGGCPVAGSSAPQPVPFLRGPAGLADPVPLVRQAGLAAVLAGQHRDDVDVIGAVPFPVKSSVLKF
jgi:hypothetical protein